jgi:hypothetical protein
LSRSSALKKVAFPDEYLQVLRLFNELLVCSIAFEVLLEFRDNESSTQLGFH